MHAEALNLVTNTVKVPQIQNTFTTGAIYNAFAGLGEFTLGACLGLVALGMLTSNRSYGERGLGVAALIASLYCFIDAAARNGLI